MKVVILAGGLGTRLSEETSLRPKPMVEIGGRPLLWHIMKHFSHYGHNDFVLCLGYKGYMIKEYFVNYYMHNSDLVVDVGANTTHVLNNQSEPWRVTLVDTGESTMTGGRLKRIKHHVDGEPFFCTYGDGLATVDVNALAAFHATHGKLATITAVQPPGRYGALRLENDAVESFIEKPLGDGAWINGGFFVLHPDVLDFIDDDGTHFEAAPLARLVERGQLGAFRHSGFWQAVDTLREKNQLEALWASGTAPWKLW
jgi:glucose-1-phosphate cytidylyltransferase